MTLRRLARLALALAIAIALSLVAFDVYLVRKAFAHDSWISHGALRNAAGEWCCGEGDCGVIDRGAVTLAPGGYRVDGFVTILGERPAGDIREEVHEFVPYAEAQPSADRNFWRCKRPDGSRRCFFAPPAPSE